MKVPNISICVVAKNAERTYGRLFSSLREFADRRGDMVLVDTGSTDQTRAIYRAFGFRVFEEGERFMVEVPEEIIERVNSRARYLGDSPILEKGSRLFNFCEARNYAASLAHNDYVANPDADEAFTVFDIDAVEEALGRYSRLQYDFVFDHKEDGSPNLQFITDTRLSDRRFWRWRGIVHETNEPISPSAMMGYVPPTVLKLEHWQVPSPTRSNYLPGLAYACEVEPGNDRNSHYYGRELLYRGFYRSAIEELKRHISLSSWPEEKSNSMLFIGDCYRRLEKDDEALDWYHRAFTCCGTRRDPLMRLAEYWYQKGLTDPPGSHAHQRAAAFVAAALEVPKDSYFGSLPHNFTHYPHEIMYWAQWWLGRKEKSKEHWQKALEICPGNQKYLSDSQFYS